MMALYQCNWRWPGVEDPNERLQCFRRVTLAVDAERPDLRQRIKGWFTYPGEWAGFLLVEVAGTEELRDILQPFTALMRIEVKPVVQVDYDTVLKQMAASASRP